VGKSDDLPLKPWRFLCNRCNAEYHQDVIPPRCARCGHPEFRIEHAERKQG